MSVIYNLDPTMHLSGFKGERIFRGPYKTAVVDVFCCQMCYCSHTFVMNPVFRLESARAYYCNIALNKSSVFVLVRICSDRR